MGNTISENQRLTNREKLAAYFESGQIPTGAHFKELIESTVNIQDDGLERGEDGKLSLHSENLEARDHLEVGEGPKIKLTGAAVQFSEDGQKENFLLKHLVDAKSLSLSGLNSSNENQEYLRIGAKGNLGIGVETPTERMHVGGNLIAEGKITGKAGMQLGSTEEGATPADLTVYGKLGLGAEPDPTLSLTVGQPGVGIVESEGNLSLHAGNGGSLSLYAGDESRLTIKNDGKVGLGVQPEISFAVGGVSAGLDHVNSTISLVNGGKVGLSLGEDGNIDIGDDVITIDTDGNVHIGGAPDGASTSKLFIKGNLEVEGSIINAGLDGGQDTLTIGSLNQGRLTVDGRMAIGPIKAEETAIALAIRNINTGLDYKDDDGKLLLTCENKVGLAVGKNGEVSIGNNSIAIDSNGNLTVGSKNTSPQKQLTLHGTLLAPDVNVSKKATIGVKGKSEDVFLLVHGKVGIDTETPEISLAVGSAGAGMHNDGNSLYLYSGISNTIVLAPYKRKEEKEVSSPPEGVKVEVSPPKVDVIIDGNLNVIGDLKLENGYVKESDFKQALQPKIFKELFFFKDPPVDDPKETEEDGHENGAQEPLFPEYYNLREDEDFSTVSSTMEQESPILKRFLSMFREIITTQETDFFIKKALFVKSEVEEQPESGDDTSESGDGGTGNE